MVIHTARRDLRTSYPADGIEMYRGKWVAFSADGSRVVASGDTELAADAEAQRLGLTPSEYILEAIPDVDTLLL